MNLNRNKINCALVSYDFRINVFYFRPIMFCIHSVYSMTQNVWSIVCNQINKDYAKP